MARTWEHPAPHPVHGPLFKVLHEDGVAEYSGAQWDITNTPGKWMTCAKGPLVPCNNGVHVCRESDLIWWIGAGETIYPVEVAGRAIVHDGGKVVARRARTIGPAIPTWNERTQRLFAADCAEQALPAFEANFRNDTRPREAIAAARKFANGEISIDALEAAYSAAYVAVSAAGSAAHYAASAAHYAAVSAAYVAHYAAYSAAREWQSRRLLQYIYGEIE